MTSETSLITVRIPADLKAAFDDACARADITGSQVIRKMMKEFVTANAQQDLLSPPKKSSPPRRRG